MITFEQVVEMLSREAEYSQGWAKGGSRKLSKVEGIEDNDVHALAPLEGQPWSMMDFQVFAEKYWNEAKQAYANFTPDGGAVRVRFLKIASLMVRALMVHGRASDVERLGGVSSSNFPIMPGGIKGFDEVTNEEGCLIPTAGTKGLRNEAPGCNPLKKK